MNSIYTETFFRYLLIVHILDFPLIYIFASKKGSPSNEEATPLAAPQTEGVQQQPQQPPQQPSQQQQQQEVPTSEIPGVLYKVKSRSLISQSISPFCLKVVKETGDYIQHVKKSSFSYYSGSRGPDMRAWQGTCSCFVLGQDTSLSQCLATFGWWRIIVGAT